MLFSCILWRGKAVGARKKQNSRNPEKRISAIFVVRRIGMTKPPVQLGVGKNTLV